MGRGRICIGGVYPRLKICMIKKSDLISKAMRPKLILVIIVGILLSAALLFIDDSSGGLNPEDRDTESNPPRVTASS